MTIAIRAGAFAALFLICMSSASARFERVEPGSSSVVVIYATEEGGTALDCADTSCQSGPVSKGLASALKIPGVTIAALFDALTVDVAATTHMSQRPLLMAAQPVGVPLVKNPGKASALVIGNGRYADFPPLKGAPRDAEIVTRGFGEIGFRTKTIIDAPLPALKAGLDEFFAQLGTEDTAVIYYAGHGLQVDGQNYLPAIDAKGGTAEAISATSLAVSDLLQRLSRSKAAAKILIIDSHFPVMKAGPAANR